MNKLVPNNYCQCQANLHGQKSVFLLFHVEARIREKEKVKYFHVWVCVYVSCISLPFVCSWHPRLGEKKRKECLKWDPSQVFSISSFIGNKKSKTSWVWTEKRSRNISSSTPSFVCNGVLKPYFMSLLTYIYIRCALNNMNYVLRYKLLIPLDFLLWHFNPGILWNFFFLVTFSPVPADVADDCHKTSMIGEMRCLPVNRSTVTCS